MKLRYCMAIGAASAMFVLGGWGAASAQTLTGNVTVVTLVDVLSNANVAQNVENSNALLNKLTADVQQAPGLVSFKVLREASRANHFIIFAVWKDMQSFEAYSGLETTRAFRQAFQPRLGGPFDERIYIDLK
jgi:quinol monooxygenase YgiN